MIRLLKLIVQPVLVDVQTDTLTEVPAQPITVSAKDWADFPAQLAAEIARLNAQAPPDGPAS